MKMTQPKTFDYIPDGWRVITNSTTAPTGFVWICNNKSLFGGEYEQALYKQYK